MIAAAAIWLNSARIHRMSLKNVGTDYTLAPWANASIAIPIILFFIASLFSIFYVREPSTFRASVMIAVLIIDLASIGFFCEWKLSPEKVVLRLPETLKGLPEEFNKPSTFFACARCIVQCR